MDAELTRRIREAAEHLVSLGATAVYVFGSVLDDRLRDDSDVDLAVSGLPPLVFFEAMAEVSRIVGRPVDLVSLERQPAVAESLHASGVLQRVA